MESRRGHRTAFPAVVAALALAGIKPPFGIAHRAATRSYHREIGNINILTAPLWAFTLGAFTTTVRRSLGTFAARYRHWKPGGAMRLSFGRGTVAATLVVVAATVL